MNVSNSTSSFLLYNLSTTAPVTADEPSELLSSQDLLRFVQAYCVLIIISGVFGNVCVLIVFISRWNRLRTYELFFVSLAIADLIGTVVYPSYEIMGIEKSTFHLEECRTVFFLHHVSITVSSLTLTSVSLDRYIAVKWIEWSSAQRKRLCKILVIATWCVGVAFELVFLAGESMHVHEGKCRMNHTKSLEIVWTTVVTYSLQNFIPIAVMILLYSLIIHELYKNSEDCRAYLTPADFSFRRVKNRKTTKLLIVVVVVFFLCVTPKSLFYMFYSNDMFGMDQKNPTLDISMIDSAFTMLKMTNACVNPMIYSRLHTSFRKRLVSFVTSRFRLRELYKSRASTMAKGNSSKRVVDPKASHANGNSHSEAKDDKQENPVIMRAKTSRKKSRIRRETKCWRLSLELEGTAQLLKESRYSMLFSLKETVL